MTADRIARWTFVAGAAFALVVGTIWRAFDWPEWLGSLATFAGASAAYRLIDRVAAHNSTQAVDREESAVD